MSRMGKMSVVVGTTAVMLAGSVQTVSASNGVKEGERDGVGDNCIARALSPDEMARGVESEIRCFDTYGEVARELGYAGPIEQGLTAEKFLAGPQYASVASNVLAVHIAYIRSGSITISGDQCNGGGLNLSADWNDRIEITMHKSCYTVKHYEHANYGGALKQTQGTWNQAYDLGPLALNVSSIKYY